MVSVSANAGGDGSGGGGNCGGPARLTCGVRPPGAPTGSARPQLGLTRTHRLDDRLDNEAIRVL
eukprot:1677393-Prymnesium_polylepis.3